MTTRKADALTGTLAADGDGERRTVEGAGVSDAKAGSARMFKVECACGVEFKCQGTSALRRRTLAHRRSGCSYPMHVERVKS